MKINFISNGNILLASYRYHNMLPAMILKDLGHETKVTEKPDGSYDVFVFSKHLNDADKNEIVRLNKLGKKTAFHVCDDHFYDEKRDHYLHMLKEANVCISPTEEMAAIAKQETGRNLVVIPDTFEMPEIQPDFHPGRFLRLLWFGHKTNFAGLEKELPNLKNYNVKYCTIFNEEEISKINPWAYIPYNIYNLNLAMEWADIVILPVNLSNKKNMVKSHNRLVESARLGKFVIASPIPAYMEFTSMMFVGDIHEGLKFVEQNPAFVIEMRVKKAQEHIRNTYSHERIGKLWEEALSS